MATITAAHLVSSHGSETMANLAQTGLRTHAITHSGLRSINMLDKLQIVRSKSNSVSTKAAKKASRSPIVASGESEGMNLVFVGAEVGPWSKTGGLGDVLGGLPPAMAVSVDFLFSFVVSLRFHS